MLENNDVPKETNNTHILGGRVGSDYSFSFYNPHNARFYFKFNKWNFKPTPELIPCNYGHVEQEKQKQREQKQQNISAYTAETFFFRKI